MLGLVYPAHGMRTHHENLFVMKARPSAGTVAPHLNAPDLPIARGVAPGLSALARLQQRGLVTHVHHVTPLHKSELKPRNLIMARVAEAASSAERQPHGGAMIVEVHPKADADALRKEVASDPHVEYATRIPVRYAFARSRPQLSPVLAAMIPPRRLWNLERIEIAAARTRKGFREPTSVRVAVLDSGLDPAHPALAGRIAGYVFAHQNLDIATSDRDLMGHGTHVTGTIVSRPDDSLGTNSLCECQMHVWKVFDDAAVLESAIDAFIYEVQPALFLRALTDCVEKDIDVVNLSLGGPGKPDACEAELLNTLLDRGTTVVAAMGNLRMTGSPTMFPAATPGVVAVGATGVDDLVAPFSSAGKHIALCAPGVGIWSTLPSYAGEFGFIAESKGRNKTVQGPSINRNVFVDAWPGTSMATPHVTAAVALLRANRPNIKGADVRKKLMQTADRVPGMKRKTFTPDYGAGRLNIRRLLSE